MAGWGGHDYADMSLLLEAVDGMGEEDGSRESQDGVERFISRFISRMGWRERSPWDNESFKVIGTMRSENLETMAGAAVVAAVSILVAFRHLLHTMPPWSSW